MEEYRFRKLIAWQRAVELATAVHRLVKEMKGRDRAEIADQMRRAALSIPANIAEGNGRNHRADYLRFLSIASGSLAELETHIEIACRLGLVTPDSLTPILELLNQVGRLLTRLTQSLRPRESPIPP